MTTGAVEWRRHLGTSPLPLPIVCYTPAGRHRYYTALRIAYVHSVPSIYRSRKKVMSKVLLPRREFQSASSLCTKLFLHQCDIGRAACSGNGKLWWCNSFLIQLLATNVAYLWQWISQNQQTVAYILTNFRPSSGMVGMVMICKNARQAPRAASQEDWMRDVIAGLQWPPRWKYINKEAPAKNLVNNLASAKCINFGWWEIGLGVEATSITISQRI